MTSTPAGSAAFFVISLFTIIVLVLLLLRYYLPLRTTPAYVTVPVFLAIALPASIVILLPIDLASSDGTDTDGTRGIWLPDKVVYKSWRVTYWLTFVLTWFILPLLGEYCDSGYREPKARLLYSLRNNGQYYAIVIGCSIAGSIYLVIWNGMHGETFKSLVMALAYAWGLILGIYLMGHGLVAFPRSLYKYASISGRLQRIQGQAPKVHERLTDALDKLDDYESQVMQLKQRKNGVTREYQEWIDELVEKCSLPENRAGAATRTRSTTVPPVITERYLAELTRKLKRARHAKLRFENEWDMIVRRAIKTQAILDSKASQRLEFKNSPFQTSNGGWMDRIDLLTPYTRYHLYVHIIPALTYFAWFVTVLASTSLVWSECVREMDGHKLSLVGWSVVHRRDSSRSSIGFGGQVIAAAWLCYMCMCAFYSLTEVKIWGNRALVRRNTYQESATWYGLQVAKLTVPLSYNFLTMTDRPIYTQTSFHKFLGQLINLSPLGKSFSAFFPLFILVPVLATTFGLYKRIRNTCGFGDLLDDEEDAEGQYTGTGSWREGRALIEREIQGASGNVLGLAQRSTTSPPNERYTDHPTPSSNAAATTSEASTSARRARPERRRPLIDDDDDEDTGNFFENFATRVKNTFETNDFTFTRPKWLGGEDDAVEAGRARREQERGGGSDRTQGFMSLFGGRADEGRLRL